MRSNHLYFKIITLLFVITTVQSVNCPRAKVERDKCIKGQRIETTTYYAQNAEGKCVEKTQTLYKPCSLLVGDHFCRCSVVGDPHYRTFNKNLIHYFGNCTYSLSETVEQQGNCSFRIRGKNEHRGSNHNVTYLRYVTIEIHGKKITLHQYKRVFIDGIIANLPVEVEKDTQIFLSGNLVQLVSPSCGIEVSFDGESNAYIMVSKEYAGKVKGMCGDCVKGHSDFVTKDGVDVSDKEDKMNLVGNSYAVESVGHGTFACHPPPPLPKTFCTKEQLEKLVKPKTQCGALIDPEGPFAKCIPKVKAQQLYESCEIDICSNAGNAKDLQKARCEIFQAMEEACAMHEVTSLEWRGVLKCPLICGQNKIYSAKMNPCPRTCENHFFGTRKQCYDLPSREGCQCKPGYLLDGMLCVKPDQCACLEGCRDKAEKSECEKWVAQGKCKTFPRLMQHVCRASCKFCKEEVHDICVDRISTERCEEYRHEGKCKKKFYKLACGLTCHPFTCPCKQPTLVETPCDKVHMVKKVTQTLWRRKHGQCIPDTESAILPCGKCGGKVDVKLDECDVCHGTQKRIEKWSKREGDLCMQEHRESMAACKKCDETKQEFRRCINNDQEEVTIIWYDAIRCKECKKRVKKVRNPVLCKEREIRDKCEKEHCYVRVSEITHKIEDCQCKRLVKQHFEKCCCTKKEEVHKRCENGCEVTLTTSYNYIPGKCISKTKVSRKCQDLPAPIVTPGTCDNKTRHAIDKVKTFYFKDCKVESVDTFTARLCKCDEPYLHRKCSGSVGDEVFTTHGYELVKNKDGVEVCNKVVKEIKREQVICPVNNQKTIGTCDQESCEATQTTTVYHRVGCKCVPEEKEEKIDCCCKDVVSEPTCVDNKLVVKKTKNKLENNKCKRDKVELDIKNPVCPEKKIEQGECDQKTGNYLEVTTFYKVIDCVCQKNVEKKIVPCHEKCPLPTEKLGDCDKKTCQQTKDVTTHTFNGVKCTKEIQTFKQPCCELKPQNVTYCDHKTGKNVTKEIDLKLSKTIGKSVLDEIIKLQYHPHNCKTEVVKKLPCGAEKPNRQKTILSIKVPDFDTCTCKEYKSVAEWEVCKCPPNKELPKECYNDRFEDLKTISYKLVNGTCQKTMDIKRSMVKCPDPVIRNTGCVKCKSSTQRIFYEAEDCKCVKKVETIGSNIDCCCNPPKTELSCLKKKYCAKVTHVEDRLNTKCIKKAYMNVRKAICDNPKQVTRTKCESCVQDEIETIFGIKDCDCVKISETKKTINCCCPRPNHKVTCLQGKRVKIETQHKLVKGECYPRIKSVVIGSQCPQESYIRGQCDWKTMTQTLRRIYFVHDENSCKCIEREVQTKIQCQCDLPMVIRKDSNTTSTQNVVLLRVFSPNSVLTKDDLTPEKLSMKTLKPGASTVAPINLETITAKLGASAGKIGLPVTPGPGSPPSKINPEINVIYKKRDKFYGKLNPQQREAFGIEEPKELPFDLTPEQKKMINATEETDVEELTKKELITLGIKDPNTIPRIISKEQLLKLEELRKNPEFFGKLTKEQKEALELKPNEELPFKLNETQKAAIGVKPTENVTKLTPYQLKKLHATSEDKVPRILTEHQNDIIEALKDKTYKKPAIVHLTDVLRKKLDITKDTKLPLLLTPDQKTKLGIKLSEKDPISLTEYQRNIINLQPGEEIPLKLTPVQREKLGLEQDDKVFPEIVLPTKKGTTGFTVVTTLHPDEEEIEREKQREEQLKEQKERELREQDEPKTTIASLNKATFTPMPVELEELRKHCNHEHDQVINHEDKECTKEDTIKKKCQKDGKTLEIISLTYYMGRITVDGLMINQCLPKVVKTIIPAEKDDSCQVIPRKHWTGCNENKRCLYEIYPEVKDCKCSKKMKLIKCVGCKCLELGTTETKCIGDESVIITKQYRTSVDECAVHETIIKRKTECPKPEKLIGLCEIKKDNALLREVQQSKSVIADCKCIEKETKELEFCHCKDTKYFYRCDTKSNNRIHTKVTYIRNGLKCEPKVNETVDNPECKKDTFLEEGKCDPTTCMKPISLHEQFLKDCKCELKKTVKSIPCCCEEGTAAVAGVKPPFKNKEICHNDFLVTLNQKIKLRTREDKVFPHADSPRMTYCSKETLVAQKKVTCPGVQIKHECDIKLNLWTYTETKYFDINCQCKPQKNSTQLEGCAEPAKLGIVCPKSKVTFTDCKNGTHFKVHTINVLLKGNCETIVKKIPLSCSCKKPIVTEKCEEGKHIQNIITETLNEDSVCEKKITTKTTNMGCTKAESKDFRVHSRTSCDEKGEQTIVYVKNIWDKEKCKCDVEYKEEKVNCRCEPCKVTDRKCQGDDKEKVTYFCQKLVDGKCTPYAEDKIEPIVCQSPGIKELHGECHADTGKQNVTLTEVKPVKCECKKINKVVERYCDCSKNPIYTPRLDLKCTNNDTLDMVHTQFEPNGTVCKPDVFEKSTKISCDLTPKLSVSQCNNCTRDLVLYNMVPDKCKCTKNVLEEKKMVCCCSTQKKVLKQSCKGNTIYKEIEQQQLIAGKCEPKVYVEKDVVQCDFPPEVKRKCDGCKGFEHLYEHRVVDCKCQPVLVKSISIDCCCKKEADLKHFCDKKIGAKVTEISVMSLVDDKCQLVTKRIEKKPKECAQGKVCVNKLSPQCVNDEKILFEVCHEPVLEDCSCKKTIKKLARVSCTCLPEERIHKTECINNERNIKVYSKEIEDGECKEKLIKTLVVPCECKDTVTEKCVDEKYMEKTYIFSKFDDKETSCITNKKIKRYPIAECNPHPKKLEPEELPCDGKKQTIITKKLIIKNCDCRIDQIPKTVKCKCEEDKKVETTCENNSTQVTTTTLNEIEKGKCVLKKYEHKVQLTGCNVKRMISGPCVPEKNDTGRSTRELFEEEFKYFGCECKVTKKKIGDEHCACKGSKVEKICKDKKLIHSTITEKLVNGKCIQIEDKKVEDMAKNCAKSDVNKKGETSPKTGLFKKIMINATVNSGCGCDIHETYQFCDEKCPKTEIKQECTGDFLLKKTIITGNLEGCRCVKNTTVLHEEPKCPENNNPVSIGPCVKGKTEGFEEHIIRQVVKDPEHCTCKIKEEKKKVLCWTDPKPEKLEVCRNDVVQTKTVTQTIVNVKTRLPEDTVQEKSDKEVKCGESKYVNKCAKNKGDGTIEVIKFEPKNCTCTRVTEKFNVDCACNPIKKLVSYGVCDKMTCNVKVRYASKTRDIEGKCVSFSIIEKEKCCCPPTKKWQQCHSEKGFMINHVGEYKLKHGKCSYEVTTTQQPVECKPVVEEVKSCDNVTGVATKTSFLTTLRGCECKNYPVNVEVGKCKCDPPVTKVTCDATKRQKIISKVEQIPNGMKCIEKFYVTNEPVECVEKKTVIEGKCDVTKGEKEIVTTQVFLDENCKCQTKVTTKKELCECGPAPNDKQECDPKTGIVTHTNFVVTKVNGQCGVKKIEYKKNTDCLPAIWTPVPSDSCMHKVFEMAVRKDCHCEIKQKKEPCDCTCETPKSVLRCSSNGHFHIKRIFKVHKHDCKCVVTFHDIPKPVYCPTMTETFEKCDTKTCLQHKNIHVYDIENCKCVKKVISKPLPCCCKNNGIKVECINAFGIKSVVQSIPQLNDGRCMPHTRRVELKTSCDKLNAELGGCSPTGKCDPRNGTQIYTCLRYTRDGCECKREQVQIKKLCTCKPEKREAGPCNPETCKKTVTIYQYFESNNECKESKEEKEFECCCKDAPERKEECLANRLLSRMSYYNYDNEKGSCIRHETVKDVTPKCEASYSRAGKCEQCVQPIYTTVQERVNCKCVKRTYISKKIACCCSDKIKLTEKCLGQVSEVTTESKVLKSDHCRPLKLQMTSRIICPPDEVHSFECNYKTCQQVVRVTRSKLDNCLCKSVVQLYHVKCCVSNNGYQVKKCEAVSGKVKEKTVTFVVNPQGGSIEKQEVVESSVTKCPENIEVKEGNCDILEEDKRYQIVKQTEYIRVACECRKIEKHTKKICGCKKPAEKHSCAPGGISELVRVSYHLVQDKSGNQVCKEFTKVLKHAPTVCPKEVKTTKTDCDEETGKRKIILTEYVRHGCKCVPKKREFLITCKCPEPEKEEVCKETYKEIAIKQYTLKCDTSAIPKCECNSESKVVREKVDCPKFTQSESPCLPSGFKNIYVTKYDVKDCECLETKRPTERIPCHTCKDNLKPEECKKIMKEGKCNKLENTKACMETCGFCYKKNCKEKKDSRIFFKTILHARLGADEIKNGKGNLIKEIPLISIKHCIDTCNNMQSCVSGDVIEKTKKCRLYNVSAEQLKKTEKRNYYRYISYGSHFHIVCEFQCPAAEIKKVDTCVCKKTELGKVCTQKINETVYVKDENKNCTLQEQEKEVACGCVDLKPKEVCAQHKAEGSCGKKDVSAICAKTCKPECQDCNNDVSLNVCQLSPITKNMTYHVTRQFAKKDENSCSIKQTVTDTLKPCDKNHCPEKEVLITDCQQGVRKIITSSYTKNDTVGCHLTTSMVTSKCESCCPAVEYHLSECVNDERTMIMEYWESKNNCCVKKTETIKYICDDKCDIDQIDHSVCLHGKRMKYHIFFVGPTCLKKYITTIVPC